MQWGEGDGSTLRLHARWPEEPLGAQHLRLSAQARGRQAGLGTVDESDPLNGLHHHQTASTIPPITETKGDGETQPFLSPTVYRRTPGGLILSA